MSTTTGPVIFGATTEGSPDEICRIASTGAIRVFRHEEGDVAQLARTAAQLMKERDEARAYTQTVVEDITEEMNGLKAGNARLLRELEELRKDKARLDWLANWDGCPWGWFPENDQGDKAGAKIWELPHIDAVFISLRAAVDAAMEARK